MFLGVLAEETGVRELHDPRHLMDWHRGMSEIVLDLRYRDICYPLAGGLSGPLLANLREILRRYS